MAIRQERIEDRKDVKTGTLILGISEAVEVHRIAKG